MQANTNETTNQDQNHSGSMLENLRRMADEIRVRIHLAGMEVKDAWGKLEPRLHEYESKAGAAKDKVVEGLDRVGDELREQMAKLLDRVRGNNDSDQSQGQGQGHNH